MIPLKRNEKVGANDGCRSFGRGVQPAISPAQAFLPALDLFAITLQPRLC